MNNINLTPYPKQVHKRIDGPWIALLVLSILIIVSSIIAIIILCLIWCRHKKRKSFRNENYTLSHKRTGTIRQIPVEIQDQQLKPYETQVYLLCRE